MGAAGINFQYPDLYCRAIMLNDSLLVVLYYCMNKQEVLINN